MRIFTSILGFITVVNWAFGSDVKGSVKLDEALSLDRVVLYNSGVNYYEYKGKLDKDSVIELNLDYYQINDILKSLTVLDPKAKEISLDYAGLSGVSPIMDKFKINPYAYTNLIDILSSKKGAWIEIDALTPIKGRIFSVNGSENSAENTISLFNEGLITTVNLKDIKNMRFLDEEINKDIEAAFSLMDGQDSTIYKNVYLNIKSDEKRDVKLAYVMEAPMYKISYRVYLDGDKALFQAWAIINNTTNFDWKDVKMSLMSSKPFSYAQDLYSPTYEYRETIGFGGDIVQPQIDRSNAHAESESAIMQEEPVELSGPMEKALSTNDTLFTAETKELNSEQFSFVLPKRVTLQKNKNLSMPLISANLPFQKFSFFSNIQPFGEETKGTLTIELKNNSDIKLPSGLVTMYDNGDYIGDAKMEYFAANDKASLSFGEDENVVASRSDKNIEKITSIGIKGGILKQDMQNIVETTYLVKNRDNKVKSIVLEHPVYGGLELNADIKPYEEKPNYNRYKFELKAGEERKFVVNATTLRSSSYEIVNLDQNRILYYAKNSEIPKKIRDIFEELLKKQSVVSEKHEALDKLKAQRESVLNSQKRARENLSAVGNDSINAKEFLNQILKDEESIVKISYDIQRAQDELDALLKEVDKFIKDIQI